jgi:hypothetical protein
VPSIQREFIMSMPRMFVVAAAVVAAAATLPILAIQSLSLQPPQAVAQDPAGSMGPPQRPELRAQIAALRDMRERLAQAGTGTERRALVNESERVMSDGVALMRRLKLDLASVVSESGEIRTRSITQAESDKITDYLGLMELLVQLKGDRDAVPAAPRGNGQPSAIQSPWRSPASVKSFARAARNSDGRAGTGSAAEVSRA